MKRFAFIIFLCLISIGGVYAQYQGNDTYFVCDGDTWNGYCRGGYHYEYYYYDAHDVDKLLAIKAVNPQSNLNWPGNDYARWEGCGWWADDNHVKHLQELTFYGNQLISLNVSGCTNLQSLQCYSNQLSSLNVSGCTSLQMLGCGSQLASLDVSGLTNLQTLYCDKNQLDSLNVSGCINLQSLGCSSNQLTSLNVSGCTNLGSLYCSNNQLNSLNVSGCSSLLVLYCSNNQLSNVNLPSLYGLNITPTYLYYYFDLRGNKGFTESAIRKLADNLPYISYEQILYDKLEEEFTLSVSPSSLNFAVSGGKQTLTVTSNTHWTVSCDVCDRNDSWIIIFPNIGENDETITITALFNTTTSQRTATITFTGEGVAPQTISVTQAAYSVELLSMDGKPMRGVAADGEAQLKIRLKYTDQNPDITRVKFSIKIPGSYDTPGKEYGYFLETGYPELIVDNPSFEYQNGISYFDITYLAPEDIDCLVGLGGYYGQKSYEIDVVTEITTIPDRNDVFLSPLKIDIIRPPLMMVHGLGGTPGTFLEMTTFFQESPYYDEWQLLPLNYSSSNTTSFASNLFEIPLGISQLLYNCKKSGYEVKKVDIVAHSMGGILTRLYLQGNLYRNNVNKFITLNTPHSGSPGANMLQQIDQEGGYFDLFNVWLHNFFMNDILEWKSLDSKREYYLNLLTNSIRYGAIRDLCVDSKEVTDNLNGKSYSNTVPTHAIYMSFSFKSQIPSFYPIIIASFPDPVLALMVLSYYYLKSVGDDIDSFISRIHGGPSDLIVPVLSQKGGLDKKGGTNVTTPFLNNYWHCSSGNRDVINQVLNLLLSTKNSGYFSMNGYDPPQLTYQPFQLPKKSLRNSSEDTYIKFKSIDKSLCTNGEEIKIQITGSSDITSMSLQIQGEYGDTYMEIKDGNSNEFSYTIPENALGYKKLLAVGYTDSQTAVLDTASFIISTSASLLSLRVSENELWVPLYGKQQVLVEGLYSDGTYKNITYLDGVRYKIKGSNAGTESPNIIVGKAEGVDTLVISCRDLETYLPIQVVDVGLEPTAIKLPVTNIQKQLICYPNPAKDHITVDYELSGSQTNAYINIYNLAGQIIKKVKLKNQIIGAQQETIAVGDLPKGIYIVVLSTNKGSSYVKLIKE